MSASSSETKSYTTSNTLDRRLTSDSGDIFNVGDNSPVTVGPGGVFSVTSADKQIAQAALDTASQLAGSSDAIAAQVADSQRAFVETASGQKTYMIVAAIAGIVAIFFFFFRNRIPRRAT